MKLLHSNRSNRLKMIIGTICCTCCQLEDDLINDNASVMHRMASTGS